MRADSTGTHGCIWVPQESVVAVGRGGVLRAVERQAVAQGAKIKLYSA